MPQIHLSKEGETETLYIPKERVDQVEEAHYGTEQDGIKIKIDVH